MKDTKTMKYIAASLAAALAVTAAGCGKSSQTAGHTDLENAEYPIQTNQKLKFWKSLNSAVSSQAASENELAFSKGLQERTGIEVEYIHPPIGQETEKFNLMIASGELPDIVGYRLSSTAEGVDGMIESGYVKELDEAFLQKYAPNFYQKLQSDSELKKWAVSNKHRLYGFQTIRQSDSMTTYSGLVLRNDWLRELGADMPETLDEWHTVLTAFKNKGVENPLSMPTLHITKGFGGAFGVQMDFYADNGVVKYGPMEDGYREFLQTMHQWYSEGLIDKSFAALSAEEVDTKILSDSAGASYGMVSSGIGKWLNAKTDDPEFSLKAAPYPTRKKGETPEFGFKVSRYDEPLFWIAGTSKNAELAAKFLDYGYGDEGHMYFNFGTEGQSYTMQDDKPVYTDLILNNPEGLALNQALIQYCHAAVEAYYEMDERFYKQQFKYDEQKDATDVWGKTNAAQHFLYGGVAIPGDQNKEYSSMMTDITKHVNEMTAKYIMGLEDLGGFDAFRERLRSMGIERAIQIKQAGYDSFMQR